MSKLDIAIRFVFLPALGLWAWQRVVREVVQTVREFREGLWD
jgi:hypothetical protein